ncbi:Bro-N domain-containing protein [Sphingopyxis sp.]|uniref:BRO-N domain-containing protein n=1 Tax=Sphingopyxis sp. TaxID=1908224 RepID=UPI003BACBFFC
MDILHPITLDYTGNAIRAVIIEGRPWFVLYDVCRAFALHLKNGIPQVDQPARRIAEGDMRLVRVQTGGGPRPIRLTSVRGLHEVVRSKSRRGMVPVNSPSPAATDRFRQWVEGEA